MSGLKISRLKIYLLELNQLFEKKNLVNYSQREILIKKKKKLLLHAILK